MPRDPQVSFIGDPRRRCFAREADRGVVSSLVSEGLGAPVQLTCGPQRTDVIGDSHE